MLFTLQLVTGKDIVELIWLGFWNLAALGWMARFKYGCVDLTFCT